jgi:hypothetical protein
MTVEAIEYDKDTNEIASKRFECVEDAVAWCEERRGEKFEHWGDTQMGYQLMTLADLDSFAATSIFPDRWYEVHGIDEEGQMRELEEGDHRGGEFHD